MNTALKNELLAKFRAHFGCEPTAVAYAPGRVEVLGNHTDYNEGLVLSAAINNGTFFAVAPSAGSLCRLVAGDLMHEVSFPADAPKPVAEDTWANYCLGVHAGLLAKAPFTEGYLGMFLGDIPQGSGLSSSAALEMTTALALAARYGIALDKLEAAKIGQKAEHTFAGVKCGLLDQISSLFGKEDMLVKTDFRSLEVENVPLSPDAVLLVCNSNAKHALVDGAYNQRREDCEAAAAYFKGVLDHPVKALRDVSWAEWEQFKSGLPARVANRAAHPVGEDERVLAGAKLLADGDLAGFGKLMFESHESSRVLFENSCEELDILVDICRGTEGVLGARLSGGGFGGSIVALVEKDKAEAAGKAIASAYAEKTGKVCGVHAIRPAEGARLVEG
ncbi:MAG: galactokinase [Kiritimatiellae bacterium]|nr:galactokinase [Kiritimatiellia bacterium]